MGLVMIFAIVTLLSNLIADIMYAVVDPRVKYE
jgi:peptide/nickel transport system permease protein